MNRIYELVQTNKRTIGIVLVSIAIIAAIILLVIMKQGGEESRHVSPIDVPHDDENDWENVTEDVEPAEAEVLKMPVYHVEKVQIDKIRGIVQELGYDAYPETVTDDDLYYSWQKDENNVVRYDVITGDLNVISGGITLSEIERGYVDEPVLEEYVHEFLDVYLDIDLDMTFSSSREGSLYRVEGTWMLDGYEMVGVFGQTYSVVVDFDTGGDLVNLYVRMFNVVKSDAYVEMVRQADVLSYVKLPGYPKEAYIEVVPVGGACDGGECDPYGMYVMSGFETASITRVDIVYYYDYRTDREVLPVYELTGTGTVTDDEGRVKQVDVRIYANAVDPSQIVIPSDR